MAPDDDVGSFRKVLKKAAVDDDEVGGDEDVGEVASPSLLLL